MSEQANTPFNVWKTMRAALHPDLRWLIDNQTYILAAWPARSMPKERPIKVWPDGRVRIEFVHTWDSFAEARAECTKRMRADHA